jgi:2-iminobutanoate/2-iminopropanoate deaminase
MSKLLKHTPATVVRPFASYSQGVEVPPNARWLHIAGQVGVLTDGRIAGDAEAQIVQAWKNVLAVLASADMGEENLVSVTVYITDAADVQRNRDAWNTISRDGGPAITMVTVKRLSDPAWTVEIAAVAAKA